MEIRCFSNLLTTFGDVKEAYEILKTRVYNIWNDQSTVTSINSGLKYSLVKLSGLKDN